MAKNKVPAAARGRERGAGGAQLLLAPRTCRRRIVKAQRLGQRLGVGGAAARVVARARPGRPALLIK